MNRPKIFHRAVASKAILSIVVLAACVLAARPATAFESNPDATHTLFLDFGEFQSSPNWPYLAPNGTPRATGPQVSPALFHANAPEGFDAQNQSAFIERVFNRVAEDYSPFDVNVTTEAPADLQALIDAGLAARVAIGGTAYHLCPECDPTDPNDHGVSGKAPPGGYLNPQMENAAFARGRENNGALRFARDIARTVSHEAAHMYGANYHYQQVSSAGNSHCLAHNTALTDLAILTASAWQPRDKWWTGIGYGVTLMGQPECYLRGDVGVLWRALGQRPPLSPIYAVNPLQKVNGTTYIGAGVITINNATWGQEQWVDFLHNPPCPAQPGLPVTPCEFYPSVIGREIGKGPNEWSFRADDGNIRIRVNTLNSQADTTLANVDLTFQLWVKNSGGSHNPAFELLVPSGNYPVERQLSDALSAEVFYTIPEGTGEKDYIVSVLTREAYGDLGQYTIEVYGGGGNIIDTSPDFTPPTITPPTYIPPTITPPDNPTPHIMEAETAAPRITMPDGGTLLIGGIVAEKTDTSMTQIRIPDQGSILIGGVKTEESEPSIEAKSAPTTTLTAR